MVRATLLRAVGRGYVVRIECNTHNEGLGVLSTLRRIGIEEARDWSTPRY